jgi:hypothetical protein
MEAIEALYKSNQSSFRGAGGVVRFCELASPHNWQALRYVHISTLFLTPMQFWMNCSLPPENYLHWKAGCEALATLQRLHLLKIDMIVWNQQDRNLVGIDNDSLLFIFKLLKQVKAQTFQIELNLELPDAVHEALGDVPFELSLHQRPYDWNAFRIF